jgi:hypothetical protein
MVYFFIVSVGIRILQCNSGKKAFPSVLLIFPFEYPFAQRTVYHTTGDKENQIRIVLRPETDGKDKGVRSTH